MKILIVEDDSKIRQELKEECEELIKKGINPKLAVIMVGDNPASKVYVRNKSRACEEIGIEYEEYLLKDDIKQEDLIELIKKLNKEGEKEYKEIEKTRKKKSSNKT